MLLLSEPVHLGHLTRTWEKEWYPMGRTPHNQQVFTSRYWAGSEELGAKGFYHLWWSRMRVLWWNCKSQYHLVPLTLPPDPKIKKTWIHMKISNRKLYRPTPLQKDYKKKKTPRIMSLVTVCQNRNGLFWNKLSDIKKNNTSHVRITKVRFRENLETKGQTFKNLHIKFNHFTN